MLIQTPELRSVLFAFDEGQELTPHEPATRADSDSQRRVRISFQRPLAAAGERHAAPPSAGTSPRRPRELVGAFTMLLTLAGEPSGIPSET